MTATQRTKLFSVGNMARMAMLTAVACLLDLIPGIPVVGFYKLDFSMLPVMLGTFSMGPVAGTIILLLKCLIGWAHSTTMGIGKLAEFIMGLAMVLPAGIIYARNKTRKTAIISMLVGTLSMVVVSVFANKWILIPFYAQMMPMEKILAMCGADTEWKLVVTATAPFNLLKGVVLCLITGLIYKPLSPILHSKAK
uniref:Riboflavin transporter n=1 Tax=uncultured bacterium Contig87 TaxID=1393621 RepID=W0FJZ0_9BACT|nr:putative membrane protein [uncultured bacterium Contig87]